MMTYANIILQLCRHVLFLMGHYGACPARTVPPLLWIHVDTAVILDFFVLSYCPIRALCVHTEYSRTRLRRTSA